MMAGRDHYKRILRLHLPPTSRDCSFTLNSSGCCAIDDGVLTGKLEKMKKNSGNASNCRGIGQEGIVLLLLSPFSSKWQLFGLIVVCFLRHISWEFLVAKLVAMAVHKTGKQIPHHPRTTFAKLNICHFYEARSDFSWKNYK